MSRRRGWVGQEEGGEKPDKRGCKGRFSFCQKKFILPLSVRPVISIKKNIIVFLFSFFSFFFFLPRDHDINGLK